MNAGDIVSIESGRYRGCRLSWVGRDAQGWHVCLNSNEAAGFVRVRRVVFVRAVARVFDPIRHERVNWNHWIRSMASAANATGLLILASVLSRELQP